MNSKKIIAPAAVLLATVGMSGCNATPATQPAPEAQPNQVGQAASAPCKASNSEGCSSQHSCIGTCIRESVLPAIEPERSTPDEVDYNCSCTLEVKTAPGTKAF
jgi:hypothetical protein